MTVRIIKKGNTVHEEKVVPSVAKRGLTLQQQRVIKIAGENVGKSKADILRRAGYGKHVVNNPKEVFEHPAVQAGLDPIIQELKDHRKQVIRRMKATIGKAGYGAATMALSVLDRDIELLSGRPTDRTHHELSQEEKDRLNKLFKKNQAK